MNDDGDEISPSCIGVYITSEHADADPKKLSKSMRRSYDKYGFKTKMEIIEFIKENADIDDYFFTYTIESQMGQLILKPLSFGNRDDLYGENEI